jgi:hypothetical protein
MSRLLINEASIMIIPSLALKLGLNEADVLQQIHYWVESSQHLIERRKWIFNTYKDWQKQFPERNNFTGSPSSYHIISFSNPL